MVMVPNSVGEPAGPLLEIAETTYDEAERRDAIARLGSLGTPVASHVLIQLYERCPWHMTRRHIVRALAATNTHIGTEFLIGLATHLEDLDLAAEAVLGLGQTHSTVAGEFLLSLVASHAHPLRR